MKKHKYKALSQCTQTVIAKPFIVKHDVYLEEVQLLVKHPMYETACISPEAVPKLNLIGELDQEDSIQSDCKSTVMTHLERHIGKTNENDLKS